MGRPPRPDSDQILLTIHASTIERQATLAAEAAQLGVADFAWRQELWREHRAAEWCPYSVELLAGHCLTSAQRKAWQRAVLRLEASGLIEIAGQRGSKIRLSKKGKKRVLEELLGP